MSAPGRKLLRAQGEGAAQGCEGCGAQSSGQSDSQSDAAGGDCCPN